MSTSITLCFSYEVVAVPACKVDFIFNNRQSAINDCKSYTNGDLYQLYPAIYRGCFFELSGSSVSIFEKENTVKITAC